MIAKCAYFCNFFAGAAGRKSIRTGFSPRAFVRSFPPRTQPGAYFSKKRKLPPLEKGGRFCYNGSGRPDHGGPFGCGRAVRRWIMDRSIISIVRGGPSPEEQLPVLKSAGWDGVFFTWTGTQDDRSLAAAIGRGGLALQSVHAPYDRADVPWESDEEGEAEVLLQIACIRDAAFLGLRARRHARRGRDGAHLAEGRRKGAGVPPV